MLVYLASDGAGFWTVLRRAPALLANETARLWFLGRVDSLEEGLEVVESLNAWLATKGVARIRRSVGKAPGGRRLPGRHGPRLHGQRPGRG